MIYSIFPSFPPPADLFQFDVNSIETSEIIGFVHYIIASFKFPNMIKCAIKPSSSVELDQSWDVDLDTDVHLRAILNDLNESRSIASWFKCCS